MIAYVFKTTNEPAGRFAVEEVTQIHAEFDRFGKAHPLEDGYYVECSGKTWTVVPEAGTFVLCEGRRAVGPTRMDAAENTRSLKSLWFLLLFSVCAYPLLLLCDRSLGLSYRLVSTLFPVSMAIGVLGPLLAVICAMPGRSLKARIIVCILSLIAVVVAVVIATMVDIATSDLNFFQFT